MVSIEQNPGAKQAPTPFASDVEVESTCSSSIVIRIGMTGIFSVEIVAEESAEEAELLEHLMAARPVLEMLRAVMRADQ